MAVTIQVTARCGNHTSTVTQHFTDEQIEFYREQHERILAGESVMQDPEPVDLLTDEDKARIVELEKLLTDTPLKVN